MKATGVVRRVDELGRIVVPKEIRKNLRIRTGTPLEIFIDATGSVVFKKHSAVAELADFAAQVAEAISATSEVNALVVDMDRVVAASGDKKRDYAESIISNELEEIVSNRKVVLLNKSSEARLVAVKRDETANYSSMVVCPILANGDCYGAVVLIGFSESAGFGDCEIKLVRTMSQFLSKHLES